MKCPTCHAWCMTKETRQNPDGTTSRRYECANLHRFNTHEVPVPPKPKKEPKNAAPKPK